MIRKIFGILCIIFAIGGAAGASTSEEGRTAVLTVSAVFFAIGLLLLLKRKNKADITAQKEQKEQSKHILTATHMAGLPLAQGTPCAVTFGETGLCITSGGNTFNVALNKLTDVQIKTNAEIQKQYVSSVGGAVGGAVLFGPLGAMVGGRAKQKQIRTLEHYLIITYLKDGNVDYLSFLLPGLSTKAINLVKQYKPLLSGSAVVDL